MLNKELLMLGGSHTNGALITEEEFKFAAATLRKLNPNIAFLFCFSPDIPINTMQLLAMTDDSGSDITHCYKLHVITDSNYVYLTQISGHSGNSPYELYFSGMGAFNYKLLYRTNDPTNQAIADYWDSGDMLRSMLRILNVPDEFDGFIVAQ